MTQIFTNIASESFPFLEHGFCNCLFTFIAEMETPKDAPVNPSSSRYFPAYPHYVAVSSASLFAWPITLDIQ